MSDTPCPFCTLPNERIEIANSLGVVIRDAYPVAPGHMLILPRRHIGSFFDLEDAERNVLFLLLSEARRRLIDEIAPAGFNIGINDGAAAGQTVAHLHIHLIPRFMGDKHDPRGGVRWIFPEKANYWSRQ